jgi:C2 domain
MKKIIAACALILVFISACEMTKNVSKPPAGVTRLKVNVVYLEVMDKNKENEKWDVGLSEEGMAPDLYYTIAIDRDQRYKSRTNNDKYLTQWLEKSDFIDIPKGSKIVFTFYDNDFSMVRTGLLSNPDDYVGTLELSTEQLLKAAQEGKEFKFERVLKCRFAVSNLMQ